MTSLRLVLFDMDDVLCAYDWHGRVAALAQACGKPAAELAASIWLSGFEDDADAGRIDADAYLAGFERRLGIPFSEADWVANRKAAMTPFDDMLDLARHLSAHVRIAILTNNGHLTARCMDRLFPQLRPLFGSDILVSAEFASQKPEPVVYERALARLGYAPGETLFTDDKPENVDGAIRAGLHGHVHAGAAALRARLAAFGLT
jgi:glucose-1-phosphatase